MDGYDQGLADDVTRYEEQRGWTATCRTSGPGIAPSPPRSWTLPSAWIDGGCPLSVEAPARLITLLSPPERVHTHPTG